MALQASKVGGEPRDCAAVDCRRELPDVNMFGYFGVGSGIGSAARGYLRALEHLGVRCHLTDLSAMTTRGREVQAQLNVSAGTSPTAPINLVCVSYQHLAAPATVQNFPRDAYTVGIWAWELQQFPAKLHEYFKYYDEIWVGSSFIADALSSVSAAPVVRIPPVLTMERLGSRDEGRRRLEVSEDEFVFAFVFDFASHVERKNPQAVIDAFARAFSPTDRVALVIKSVNAQFCPGGLETLVAAARGLPIRIIADDWPAAQVRDLMAAADAYISLHRSEGTGLTISEAMSHGKPVIATAWSGNMDFMTAQNSFPVKHDFATLQRNIGPYPAGERWAEPSVADAARWMRHVFEHRDQAQAIGERARRDIAADYDERAVGRLIRDRLEVIASRSASSVATRLARHRGEPDKHASYRQLVVEIRRIVDKTLPSNAVVAVVSKGDDALLDLGQERRGMHFPQTVGGVFAGCYPADDDGALASLAAARRSGATHLLIPATAMWWLDVYRGFADALGQSGRRVLEHTSCVVYPISADVSSS